MAETRINLKSHHLHSSPSWWYHCPHQLNDDDKKVSSLKVCQMGCYHRIGPIPSTAASTKATELILHNFADFFLPRNLDFASNSKQANFASIHKLDLRGGVWGGGHCSWIASSEYLGAGPVCILSMRRKGLDWENAPKNIFPHSVTPSSFGCRI